MNEEQPQAPKDVRVKLGDGSWLELKVRYRGIYDGFHDWLAEIPEGTTIKLPMESTVGELPGESQITMRYYEP